MNREITFRGICEESGEFVYGDLVTKQIDGIGIVNDLGVLCIVKPETLGQYIGKRDRNGKKIYEKDIIKREIFFKHMKAPNVSIEVVKFSAPAFRTDNMGLHSYIGHSYEVVGDEYHNPELVVDIIA